MLRKDIFGSSQQPDNTDRINRIIAGTEINGDLTSDSNILLEGEVNGNVSCAGRVIVGTSGKINGNLVCVNAEIDGAMDGQLMVENLLVLRSTARIKGDIQTMKLHIEEGAFFEGACVMRAGLSTPKLDAEAAFND
ncbi:MAG: polymer-forming cytoskeletal protein [Sphingomonadales bacterium]|jgi:cytoskeletal protein CcmA (bactofilin family)